MRTAADRLRHALSFEASGLLIVMSAGILFFGQTAEDVGAIATVASLIAAVWAYGFNYLFDVALLRLQGRTQKTVTQRVVHALAFEASLLVMMLPFVAWHLQLSLMDAFLMDAALASFYIVYAFVFNWFYDYRFPVADESAAPAFSMGSACLA
jgi:uncharacterized membrane protein